MEHLQWIWHAIWKRLHFRTRYLFWDLLLIQLFRSVFPNLQLLSLLPSILLCTFFDQPLQQLVIVGKEPDMVRGVVRTKRNLDQQSSIILVLDCFLSDEFLLIGYGESGSRAICLFCTPIHSPWTQKKTLTPYIYNASNKEPF